MTEKVKLLPLDPVAVRVEDLYRLRFLRGPEGIIVELAEQPGHSRAADFPGNSRRKNLFPEFRRVGLLTPGAGDDER